MESLRLHARTDKPVPSTVTSLLAALLASPGFPLPFFTCPRCLRPSLVMSPFSFRTFQQYPLSNQLFVRLPGSCLAGSRTLNWFLRPVSPFLRICRPPPDLFSSVYIAQCPELVPRHTTKQGCRERAKIQASTPAQSTLPIHSCLGRHPHSIQMDREDARAYPVR